jgi:fructose-1,6-bisphosphatase III
VDPSEGMIVNGHVPVKVEKGESPLKKSGKAVTIDGAFSQAYGDHGFTLVLEPQRTFIATHALTAKIYPESDSVSDLPAMDNTRRCPPGRRTQPKPRGDPHGRFDPTTRPLSLAGEPSPPPRAPKSAR